LVLEARAHAALRNYAEAWPRFERIRASAARIDAPSVLHGMGISAVRTGHIDVAVESYRALVSRVELLDDSAEQVRILIEAALLAMRQGPEHIAEAIGYLTEARRIPRVPGLSEYLVAALAIAFDRQGLTDEAKGVVAEASGPWRLESDRERIGAARELPELLPGEIDAMVAVLAESHDREIALERWQSYLDGEAGKSDAAAEWARRRKDALLGKGRRKRASP